MAMLYRTKRTSDWKLDTWNCRSSNFIGNTRTNLRKDPGYDIEALQKVWCIGHMVHTFEGKLAIKQSCSNTRELQTIIFLIVDMKRCVIDWWLTDERTCRLWI